MQINIIKSYRDVIAVCDSDLIGKVFEEGKFQLDLKENFYMGEEVSFEKAVKIMKDMQKEDATFNIVGHEATKAALKAGIIDKESIGIIQDIPFALVLM